MVAEGVMCNPIRDFAKFTSAQQTTGTMPLGSTICFHSQKFDGLVTTL